MKEKSQKTATLTDKLSGMVIKDATEDRVGTVDVVFTWICGALIF